MQQKRVEIIFVAATQIFLPDIRSKLKYLVQNLKLSKFRGGISQHTCEFGIPRNYRNLILLALLVSA